MRLSKEQHIFVEKYLSEYHDDKVKAIMNYVPIKGLSYEDFVRGMLEGFECELTPEEKIQILFHSKKMFPYRAGIRDCLNALDIKVEGINC